MTGIGHFTVGFILGFMVFVVLRIGWPRSIVVRSYGPCLSIALGVWAALPYALLIADFISDIGPMMNIFLGYHLLSECQPCARVLGNFYVSLFLVSGTYFMLMIYYIREIKLMRSSRHAK